MRVTFLTLILILAWICVPSSAQDADLKTLIDTGKYTEAESTARKVQNSNAPRLTSKKPTIFRAHDSKAICAAPNYSN
jgi:hypothetical protein